MWFTETPWPPVFALICAAVVLLLVGSRNGRGLFVGLAVACVLLIGVVIVVERFIVTPAEEVELRVAALRDAAVQDDAEGVVAFFSPTALPEMLKVRAAMAFGRLQADVHLSDVTVQAQAGGTLATSLFRANGSVESKPAGFSQHIATRWRLGWRKEGGEWKIFELDRLNPITGERISMLGRE